MQIFTEVAAKKSAASLNAIPMGELGTPNSAQVVQYPGLCWPMRAPI
jgi:hypothetical protein